MKIDAWLAELKIPRENYRLVMMLPMVYVAWADGRIQAALKLIATALDIKNARNWRARLA